MTQNPFQNPDLLDGALAADLGAAEAWQAEHQPVEATLATHGLAEATRQATLGRGELEASPLVENLREQYDDAFTAYKNATSALGWEKFLDHPVISKNEFDDLLEHQLEMWSASGTLDWVGQYTKKTGHMFRVVAVPNADIRFKELNRGIRQADGHADSLHKDSQLLAQQDGIQPRLFLFPEADNGDSTFDHTLIAEGRSHDLTIEPAGPVETWCWLMAARESDIDTTHLRPVCFNDFIMPDKRIPAMATVDTLRCIEEVQYYAMNPLGNLTGRNDFMIAGRPATAS